MAAGASSRMGSPKQLLPFGGRPLIRFVAETALSVKCGPVYAVVGAHQKEIVPALADLDVQVVANPEWEGGMGTSIRAGVEAADHDGCTAVILTLADQPFVSAAILARLVEAHQAEGKPVVASSYARTVGVPVLFTREYFSALRGLAPAQGCKQLILSCGEEALLIGCPEAERDIDTPADYVAAQRESA